MTNMNTRNITDNFDFFYDYMTFESPDDFYHVQIMLRKKDEPTAPANNRLIKAYYIMSVKDLKRYESEIKTICAAMNARAYINPGKKSMKTAVLKTMESFSKRLADGNIEKIYREFNSQCGSIMPKDRVWIIDIDNPYEKIRGDISRIMAVNDWIDNNKVDVKAKLWSVSGIHILTGKFNSKKFSEDFPDIDLHKNNPTILYYEQVEKEKSN